MKKPLLTTIGLAGACAACCAVPLLVPIISGLWGNLGLGANSNGKVQGFTLGFYGNNGQCGLPIESPMAEINLA